MRFPSSPAGITALAGELADNSWAAQVQNSAQLTPTAKVVVQEFFLPWVRSALCVCTRLAGVPTDRLRGMHLMPCMLLTTFPCSAWVHTPDAGG